MSVVRLTEERGEVTLTSLLVAIIVSMFVLGSTLSIFEMFVVEEAKTNERNDMQDRARIAIDRLAREMRNLASPTHEHPEAVDRATATDIIFQTVDSNGPNAGLNTANVKRMRYCVDPTPVSNGRMYVQEQTWTTEAAPAVPSSATCPGPGWGSEVQVAERITNGYGGQNRPIFSFNSAVLTEISSIHVDLYLDTDPLKSPPETHLTTGVFLRNQNRVPTADFTGTRQGAAQVVLNGSLSTDPEGHALSYVWWDCTSPPCIKVGDGITFTYDTVSSPRTIQLKVFDPAGLEGDSATKVV